MEEQAKPANPSPPARPWPAWRWLVVLFLLVGGLRAWHVWQTEVLARDSIGFICLAWQFEHEPTRQVLRTCEYHPGYPLLILLTSLPMRQFAVAPESVALQAAAQTVSVVASLLLIVPMFLLGRALFNNRVAFWACLLFQFLPASGRVLADGLNEATFLLFTVTGLYLAWEALRRRSWLLFGLCGLCGGLAYLVRPEGALIVAATGLVLVVGQVVASWRRPWRSVLACGASLAVGAVLVGGPCYALSGRVIMKPSGRVLEGAEQPTPVLPEKVPVKEFFSEGAAPGSPLWAIWWLDYSKEWPTLDWRWGGYAVCYEAVKGFHHVLLLPAFLGLFWHWRRTAAQPGTWVLGLTCVAILLLLWRLASTMGYVSDRHMMIVVLCTSFWVVAGLEVLAAGLVRLVGERGTRWARMPADSLGRAVACFLMVVAVVSTLNKLLEPLHSDRAGFREVGLWLGDHVGPEDAVLDPYRWSSYYAGQDFHPHPTLAQARKRWVVLEESENHHGHLGWHQVALQLRSSGEEVYSWSGKRGEKSVKIVVFTLPAKEK